MKTLKYFLVFVRFTNIQAARILAIFPTPSISHQVVFRPITQELVKRGHEVTVITPDPVHSSDPDLINLIEIDLHNISYSIANEDLLKTYGKDQDLYSQVYLMVHHFMNVFDNQLKTKELQKILQKGDKYYDLLLLESCVRATLVFSHVFKAPVIQISSLSGTLTNYKSLGVPIHPLVYFSALRKKLYNLSFWDKFREIKLFLYVSYIHSRNENLQNGILRRHFGSRVPTIDNLNNNIDMLFLATNAIWAGNTPMPPSVIFIGGIHVNRQEEEMQKDLKSFLDSSINGAVYISFGSNVRTNAISSKISQIFLEVFTELKFDVVWKWDGQLSNKLPVRKNIKYYKWLPQLQVLRHPNVKVFITQGGLQSTDEAILAGVPLIGIPILVDQWYNTDQYVHFNIGVKLDYSELNRENLRDAITKVANERFSTQHTQGGESIEIAFHQLISLLALKPAFEISFASYRENILKLRSLILDQPQTPLERAIWWTEHIIRNGNGRHLRSPSANMPWTKFFELELLGFLFISLFIMIIIFYVTMRYVCIFTAKRIIRNVKEKSK